MERRSVAAGYVHDALQCLHERGIDPAPALHAASLPEIVNAPVSNEAYGRLWIAIAGTIDDEFFGLGARPMRQGSFRLLCHSVLHTKNMEHALRRALHFMRIVLDDPHGTLRVENDLARIELHGSGGRNTAFAYRTFWLILMGVLCWLVGRRVPLRWLDFDCAAPADRPDYHTFFGAPARFGQPATTMVFDAAHLRLPVIRTERALRLFLQEAPGNILVRYRQDHGAAGRVRRILGALPPAEWPTFETLAKRMNIPPATLRRQLKADGQPYQAIKDDLRFTRAQKMLARSRLTMATIAADLGYSEASAFYRAFRKRAGMTPDAYRRMSGKS